METVYAKDRKEWRNWLRKNAARCAEAWLVYYKKSSGQPTVSYDEAVEEALCFGWIDGKTKTMDESCYAQRFTPRKPKSAWAESNIRRMKRLIVEGRMTPAGLRVYNPSRVTPPMPTQMPKNLESQFQKHSAAWANYQNFPPYYRRMTAGWVASAKKEETRVKRLEKLIDYSARNERIQFM
jgi:uncharacterized protein YdeI (YjbR/CyaY-like superfamily)